VLFPQNQERESLVLLARAEASSHVLLAVNNRAGSSELKFIDIVLSFLCHA
jgi:hypothetical protein